jgi:hypothetical protein
MTTTTTPIPSEAARLATEALALARKFAYEQRTAVDGNDVLLSAITQGQLEAAIHRLASLAAPVVAQEPRGWQVEWTTPGEPHGTKWFRLFPNELDAINWARVSANAVITPLYAGPTLQAPRWISPLDEMPPPMTTVPTLAREKRSTTGWAHSYGSWSDDPDDNSRPDSKMFKARTEWWCRLPTLPAKPVKAPCFTAAPGAASLAVKGVNRG